VLVGGWRTINVLYLSGLYPPVTVSSAFPPTINQVLEVFLTKPKTFSFLISALLLEYLGSSGGCQSVCNSLHTRDTADMRFERLKRLSNIIAIKATWGIIEGVNTMRNCLPRIARQVNMPAPIDFGELPDLQQFADSSELSEVQQFLEMFRKQHLERCFLSELPDAGLKEFFIELAELRKQPVNDVTKIFCQAADKIALLVERETQLRTQEEQLDARLKRFTQFSEGVASGKVYSSGRIAKLNFERSLFPDLLQSLYFQIAEAFEQAADILDIYWSYLSIDMQEALMSWCQAQSVDEKEISKNAPNEYRDAVLHLRDSLAAVQKIGYSSLPFRVSSYVQYVKDRLKLKCINESTKLENSTPIPLKKKYTLEEMLEGVTPENSHEATDWGPPVGEEFW